MKKILLLFITIIMMLSMTACVKIEGRKSFYTVKPIETEKRVLLSVDCSDIISNLDKLDDSLLDHIPEYGLIIPDDEYPFESGDTVYDVLLRAAKENKVQLESKGFFGSREIEGINYIYNSSCGNGSRWIYKVNGQVQQPVCSEYKVKDGDIIQWIYVCNEE